MAKAIIDLFDPPHARREISCEAALEISDILQCLDWAQDTHGEIPPGLWRGMRQRIEELTSSIVSANCDELADEEKLADRVFGPNGWKVK